MGPISAEDLSVRNAGLKRLLLGMRTGLRNQLKSIPQLVKMKRSLVCWREDRKTSKFNVLDVFPLYIPNSSGQYEPRAELTIQTINQIFPLLARFAGEWVRQSLVIKHPSEVFGTDEHLAAAEDLGKIFNNFGSDKAVVHNYHYLYGPLLAKREEVQNIFEVGLGTNNVDVVSNMGPRGRPGASLRAFKSFCPNAQVIGADIDNRVLFEEERISTFHVDQTDLASVKGLVQEFEKRQIKFDLIIDDGLHSPDANLNVLHCGLSVLKPGGWLVVEDIHKRAAEFWQVVAAMLPNEFSPYLFRSGNLLIFAVQRVSH
jgi:SAM-dependent methyltransferase